MTTETPKPPKLRKTGSQRQLDYVARMKTKGYCQLMGLWVPTAIKDQCRELVKNHVSDWESNQIPATF